MKNISINKHEKVRKKKSYSIYVAYALIILLIIAGIGSYVWKQERRVRVLEIYIFNMKSGRSMFIRTPGDGRVLVDGGSNSDIIRELTKILPFYSRRIDSVIATNTEGKNVAGLIDVFERYDVGNIYIPAVTLQSLGIASSTDQIFETLMQNAKSAGIKVGEVGAGQVIEFDRDISAKDDKKVLFTALFPVINSSSTDPVFRYSKASAPEIMMKISYKNTAIILMGDASVKVQKFVASSTGPLRADVLVVSHSALPANMASRLVDEIKPKIFIYSKIEVKGKDSSTNAALKSDQLKVATSIKPKKPVIDPMVNIPPENRLNIKKEGTTHLISDGLYFRVSE